MKLQSEGMESQTRHRREINLILSLSELLTHELSGASSERREARSDVGADILQSAHIHGGRCICGGWLTWEGAMSVDVVKWR